MKCKLNDKCEFGDLCKSATRHDSLTVLGCSSYKAKEPMTNEEWLRKANKEEMEHALTMLIMKDRFFADKEFAYVNTRFKVHCWLKEKHE